MLFNVHRQSEGGVEHFKINFVFQPIINSLQSLNMCLEQIKEQGGMLLFNHRGGNGWEKRSGGKSQSGGKAMSGLQATWALHLCCQPEGNGNSCLGVKQ